MRISDWSSDVCSSDLQLVRPVVRRPRSGRTVPRVPEADGRLRLAPHVDAEGDQFAEGLGGERGRSEERRVGKESASTCRSRQSPYHTQKKINTWTIKVLLTPNCTETYHRNHNN